MTEYICDRCKDKFNNNAHLTFVKLEPKNTAFEYMNKNGLIQGLSVGYDLCPECVQKANWALVNFISGGYEPVNPIKGGKRYEK